MGGRNAWRGTPSLYWFLFVLVVAGLNVIIVSTVGNAGGTGRGLLGRDDDNDRITLLSANIHFAVSSDKESQDSIARMGNESHSNKGEQRNQSLYSLATETVGDRLDRRAIKKSFENFSNNQENTVEVTSLPIKYSSVTGMNSKTSELSSSITDAPYFMYGKTAYQNQKFHRKKTFQRIDEEEAKPIDASQKVWVLPDPVKIPTRNHESILLEYDTTHPNGNNSSSKNNEQILVNILGRYSRSVQWMDLKTGEQRAVETNGTDPDQRPLNDLNHVASVVVDSFRPGGENHRTRKEVWLPCGFHNDRIGNELSSNYARIVDLETMAVRTGPKLPFSGGACGAAPIEAIPGEPTLVCSFGGTNGNHDTGIFLPYVSCYDRVTEKWLHPFGKLPVGMDHLSVAVVPKAACHQDDPARVLVFNFRTKNYATHASAEILAFDIPKNGWTREELVQISAEEEGEWYTFANHSFTGGEDEAYAPRDASGVVMANGGRSIVNFGGINQIRNPRWKKKDRSNGPKVFSTWYPTIRELNVCSRTWEKVADMGIQTFALMASASTQLNVAFFCGGSMYRQDYNGNTNLCLATKIPGIDFWNHRTAAVENFPQGFEAGGEATVEALVSRVER
ncbi:unnamed protein product [Pseudo-nitzschia multistriata]|uniref:Uncharacterized protein n=1 Tax=Pseudo-nitzschia multistriata TaxID=183589 RepID=A0A448ZKL1_9STRA|nr:unnamed protein product [Pseudo-nitzschia multistriata]